MAGCRYILDKLQTFPVKEASTSILIDTLVNAALGSAIMYFGSSLLGLNRLTGTQMGAAGNASFGFLRSLIESFYNHFTAPVVKEEVKEEPKSLRERTYNYFSSFISTKQPEVKQPEPEETKGINYAVTLFNLIKTPCYGILGSMLGYAMLNLPSSFSIQDVAESAAIGEGVVAAMAIFIVAAALCAPRVADVCVDKIEPVICCEGSDVENQQSYRAPSIR